MGENDAKMLRVDKNFIGKRRKRVAFSNEYGYVWTGPQGKRGKLKPGTGRQNKTDYHTKFTNQDRFTKGLCRESTSEQGHLASIFGKYLFGRRFEI